MKVALCLTVPAAITSFLNADQQILERLCQKILSNLVKIIFTATRKIKTRDYGALDTRY